MADLAADTVFEAIQNVHSLNLDHGYKFENVLQFWILLKLCTVAMVIR